MSITIDGTAGLSGDTGYLRLGSLDPENRIINGAFDFWQRGTSFTANAYGADRWFNGAGGGTVTMSRQAFSVGDTLGSNNPTYFLRQTVSGQSTSVHAAYTDNKIESVRSYAGQTITILGWARRSSGSGNIAVEPVQDFGSGGSPSSRVFVSPQTVTLTGSWTPFALTYTIPSISGKTVGTTNDGYLVIYFWTSAGSDYNARTNSLGLQTIGVDLWGIHIKQGTHTTSAVDLYRQPELGPELARCQRYHTRLGGVGYSGIASGMQRSTTTAAFNFLFPTTMRSSPSVTYSELMATDRTRYEEPITSLSATTSTHGAYVDTAWTTARGAAFDGTLLSVRNGTTGSIILDAEL